MAKKILITGGAGFIGSNLANKLAEEGKNVSILDDLSTGSKKNLIQHQKIDFFQGSVNNPNKLEKAISGCDKIVHLAALSSAPMHENNFVEGCETNLVGFLKVLEKAESKNIEKVVYASTSSMNNRQEPPHTEKEEDFATNYYTASKLGRELYADVFGRRSNVEITGLRFFSVYGPGEEKKGEYANIVSQFAWRIMDGKRPLVYGEGEQTRDFIYVKDVVDAIKLSLEIREVLDGEVFNIGTGKETSFNKVIEMINHELNENISPKYTINPIKDYVKRTKADMSQTESTLGFEPSHSLSEGLRKTIQYYGSD